MTKARRYGRRGDAPDNHDLARFQCRELAQGVGGRRVQQRHPNPARDEQRREQRHCPPIVGDEIFAKGRARRHDGERDGERRGYGAGDDTHSEEEHPEVKPDRGREV